MLLMYREDRVPTSRLLIEDLATKGYSWLVSGQMIEDRRPCLRGRRGGYARRFEVIDFDRGLVGSPDPIWDMLMEDLSTHARSVIVAKAAIELFKGRIRIVSKGGPHEVVGPVGVVGE